MTDSVANELRERVITLPASTHEEDRRRLAEELRALAPIEEILIDGQQCRIRYRFPDITFGRLWSRLRRLIHTLFPAAARVRYGLAAIMEDNERDYRLYACGWHRYVETVHARRFDPLQAGGGDVRKQQWQQYTGRRRGTT